MLSFTQQKDFILFFYFFFLPCLQSRLDHNRLILMRLFNYLENSEKYFDEKRKKKKKYRIVQLQAKKRSNQPGKAERNVNQMLSNGRPCGRPRS